MNSILQCLSNTPDLRDYCLTNVHRLDLGDNCTANTTLMEGTRLDDIVRAPKLDPKSPANAKSEFGLNQNIQY